MSINHINTDELRYMKNKEGLVIQGCGGDPQEWLDGINNMLADANILVNGSRFESCTVFENEGINCILFPFDDVELDYGKFAVWRLKTHAAFYGTWLSDYVPNRLGGFIESKPEKPLCKIIGADGNIFNLMAIASKALRDAGQGRNAEEMCSRMRESGNYHEALAVMLEYVEAGSVDEDESFDMELKL